MLMFQKAGLQIHCFLCCNIHMIRTITKKYWGGGREFVPILSFADSHANNKTWK